MRRAKSAALCLVLFASLSLGCTPPTALESAEQHFTDCPKCSAGIICPVGFDLLLKAVDEDPEYFDWPT